MTVNEYIVDAVKRNLVSPMYPVDEKAMEKLNELDWLDEIRLIKDQLDSALGTLTEIKTNIKERSN